MRPAQRAAGVRAPRPGHPATGSTAGGSLSGPGHRRRARVFPPGGRQRRRPRRPSSIPAPPRAGRSLGTSRRRGAAIQVSDQVPYGGAEPAAFRGTDGDSGTSGRAGPAAPAGRSTGPAPPAPRRTRATPAPPGTAAQTSSPAPRSGSRTPDAAGRLGTGTPTPHTRSRTSRRRTMPRSRASPPPGWPAPPETTRPPTLGLLV